MNGTIDTIRRQLRSTLFVGLALCFAAVMAMTKPALAMDMIPFLGGEEETEEGKKEPEPVQSSDPVYFTVDNLTAPVYRRNRIRHHILLTLNIETPGQSEKNEAIRMMPRLRDAMLYDLYTDPIAPEATGDQIDLIEIKLRMLEVAKKVLGEKRVVDVLIVKTARTG